MNLVGLEDDNPCKARLVDACNGWIAAAVEMVDANADQVERRVARISEQALRTMRYEAALTAAETQRVFYRRMQSTSRALLLLSVLLAGVTGFAAGRYYEAYSATVLNWLLTTP